ncbi:hypothetical protein NKH77_35395 [Streptomyces sp. M19]
MTEVEVTMPHPAFPMERRCRFQPPAEYALLRDHRPVSRVTLPDGSTARVVTSHQLVRQILSDPRTSADPDTPAARGCSRPARVHPAARAATGRTRPAGAHPPPAADRPGVHDQARPGLRPAVRRIVDERVDAVLDAGLGGGRRVDLMAVLARPVPTLVTCAFLGLSGSERDALLDACRAVSDAAEAAGTAGAVDAAGGVAGLTRTTGATGATGRRGRRGRGRGAGAAPRRGRAGRRARAASDRRPAQPVGRPVQGGTGLRPGPGGGHGRRPADRRTGHHEQHDRARGGRTPRQPGPVGDPARRTGHGPGRWTSCCATSPSPTSVPPRGHRRSAAGRGDRTRGEGVFALLAAANRDPEVFPSPTGWTCGAPAGCSTSPSVTGRTSASAPTSPGWSWRWSTARSSSGSPASGSPCARRTAVHPGLRALRADGPARDVVSGWW